VLFACHVWVSKNVGKNWEQRNADKLKLEMKRFGKRTGKIKQYSTEQMCYKRFIIHLQVKSHLRSSSRLTAECLKPPYE
jgi:hypothetical protein